MWWEKEKNMTNPFGDFDTITYKLENSMVTKARKNVTFRWWEKVVFAVRMNLRRITLKVEHLKPPSRSFYDCNAMIIKRKRTDSGTKASKADFGQIGKFSFYENWNVSRSEMQLKVPWHLQPQLKKKIQVPTIPIEESRQLWMLLFLNTLMKKCP